MVSTRLLQKADLWEVDGAGRLAGGLGASRDACTVDKVLARCEPLTNFAARAAAVVSRRRCEVLLEKYQA